MSIQLEYPNGVELTSVQQRAGVHLLVWGLAMWVGTALLGLGFVLLIILVDRGEDLDPYSIVALLPICFIALLVFLLGKEGRSLMRRKAGDKSCELERIINGERTLAGIIIVGAVAAAALIGAVGIAKSEGVLVFVTAGWIAYVVAMSVLTIIGIIAAWSRRVVRCAERDFFR